MCRFLYKNKWTFWLFVAGLVAYVFLSGYRFKQENAFLLNTIWAAFLILGVLGVYTLANYTLWRMTKSKFMPNDKVQIRGKGNEKVKGRIIKIDKNEKLSVVFAFVEKKTQK